MTMYAIEAVTSSSGAVTTPITYTGGGVAPEARRRSTWTAEGAVVTISIHLPEPVDSEGAAEQAYRDLLAQETDEDRAVLRAMVRRGQRVLATEP